MEKWQSRKVMIYIEFKNKTPLGYKKLHYAKVLARIIKLIKHFKAIVKHKEDSIEIDYKVIFK